MIQRAKATEQIFTHLWFHLFVKEIAFYHLDKRGFISVFAQKKKKEMEFVWMRRERVNKEKGVGKKNCCELKGYFGSGTDC